MALKKVKGTLERVLDKNMQDLVRGIRNHKDNEVCQSNTVCETVVSWLSFVNVVRVKYWYWGGGGAKLNGEGYCS